MQPKKNLRKKTVEAFNEVFWRPSNSIVYSVKSEKSKDRFYEVTVVEKKIIHCSCPGWQFNKTCKHSKQIRYEKLTQSPEDKQRERTEAQKYGRQVAEHVSKSPAYRSVSEKVEEDKELQEFMQAVS